MWLRASLLQLPQVVGRSTPRSVVVAPPQGTNNKSNISEHPPNLVGTQQVAPLTSAPASSPPPPAPAAAGLGVDGDAVGDMKMADSTGKRGAAEMDDDKEPEMGDDGQAAGHHRIEAQQTIDRAKLAVTQASGSKGKGVGGRSPP